MSDEMQRYYALRAPEYEQIYFRDIPDRRRELDAAAASIEKIAQGKTVLELASGTGYWTQVMSNTAERIMAVDLAPEMVREARKKQYQCPVELVHGDLYEMPFERSGFDLVALGFWMSHHPRQRFGTLFDVLVYGLKPDGKIWVVDNNPPAEGPELKFVRTDEHGNNYKQRRLNDGREFVVLKNYFSEAELKVLFSTRFDIESMVYGTYYWSSLLSLKTSAA
ncbi:MAG: class I SAM-dependent methyltransferase [Candidatus Zixiibacteriota bacterium]|nr:MAG: class I SAM-dependent methyltransferase [candidate division Zixibacteria bacterium]